MGQRCDECIERLEEFCCTKRLRLAVGYKQIMVTKIARLADAKSQLEQYFVHTDGEYTRVAFRLIADGELAAYIVPHLIGIETDEFSNFFCSVPAHNPISAHLHFFA